MNTGFLVAIVSLALAVIALVLALIHAHRSRPIPQWQSLSSQKQPTSRAAVSELKVKPTVGPVPAAVPIPEHPSAAALAVGVGDSRAMEIRLATSNSVLGGCSRVDSSLVRTALASVPQALPQLVLAQQVSGMHLMEVVVRGDLVRAASGGGWRAFTLGPNGIEQQARLFNVGGLQALASGLMVWQLASILFGQKHLQDINRQLERIDRKLDKIISMLRGERRATIFAGWRYVKDAVHAAEAGELSETTRHQLESIEHQLTSALYAMRVEFDDVRARPLARGTIGTAKEFDDVRSRLDEYRSIFEDMSACIEVRQACCYAASLYPGGRVLLSRRLQGLQDDVRIFATASILAKQDTMGLVQGITSVVNREATLEVRREEVQRKLHEFTTSVTENAGCHDERGRRIVAAMSAMDQTRTLYLTVSNGKIVDVHEAVH